LKDSKPAFKTTKFNNKKNPMEDHRAAY